MTLLEQFEADWRSGPACGNQRNRAVPLLGRFETSSANSRPLAIRWLESSGRKLHSLPRTANCGTVREILSAKQCHTAQCRWTVIILSGKGESNSTSIVAFQPSRVHRTPQSHWRSKAIASGIRKTAS